MMNIDMNDTIKEVKEYIEYCKEGLYEATRIGSEYMSKKQPEKSSSEEFNEIYKKIK